MTLPIPDIVTVTTIIVSLVGLAAVFAFVVYMLSECIKDAIGRGLNL